MYDTLLSRSFTKQEKKKFGYGGLLLFFLFLFTFFTVFKPFFAPFPVLNLRLSMEAHQKMNILNVIPTTFLFFPNETVINNSPNTNTSHHQSLSAKIGEVKVGRNNDKNLPIFTNTTNYKQIVFKEKCRELERSDFCEIEGDIRINGNLSTVFVLSSQQNNSWRSIRPYARKGDFEAMNIVRQWSLKLVSHPPPCSRTLNIPAILFSVGGYSGNHFHSFTDILLPLYSTSRRFNGSVQFLLTDTRPWWVSKFRRILKGLSKYEIIDADRIADQVLCFKSITVGLIRVSKRELATEAPGTSMKDFRQLLRSGYSLRKTRVKLGEKKRPRLVIISRKRSRAFTNVDAIAGMAKRLGFKVVVHEPDADVSRSAQVMNSCDVVLGVHGAGLTNIVFLAENAILIQVVPFGGAEWVSKKYFEEPSKDMNLRYLEYKISINESSLVKQYPPDDVVLTNPYLIHKQGWLAFKSIYFDNQNVNLDLNRFRPTLLKALYLLRH